MRLLNIFLLLLIVGKPAHANNFFSEKGIGKNVAALKKCNDAYRYGYNGKLKDNEWAGLGNHYDYGARHYDPRIARWSGIDPLFLKYPNFSPYNFGLNSPIGIKDDDGRDIIILNAPQGARLLGQEYGHAAVLIGNDKTGWYFYSKNGTNSFGGFSGPSDKDPRIAILYHSLNEFANLVDNQDKEHPGHAEYRYAYRLETTPAQDAAMMEAARKQIMEPYGLLSSSCIDVVCDALKISSFNVPKYNFYSIKKGQTIIGPNDKFEWLKEHIKGRDISNLIQPSNMSDDRGWVPGSTEIRDRTISGSRGSKAGSNAGSTNGTGSSNAPTGEKESDNLPTNNSGNNTAPKDYVGSSKDGN